MRKTALLWILLVTLPVCSQSRTERDSSLLISIDDKEVQSLLSGLKGNVVVVNIWATWCKPCVVEFPHLVKLRTAYEKKGVSLIFISVDESEEIDTAVLPFLRKQKVSFPTYIKSGEDEPFMDAIGKGWRGAIPTTFIFDRAGKQAATLIGAKDFKTFEEVIKPLLP
jgi:thiol-disulfide isomerase/thioredoxin